MLISYAGLAQQPYDRGEFRLKLSLPYFNHFNARPEGIAPFEEFGFLGEAIGVQYAYRRQRFFEATFSLASAAKQPLPFPIDHEGAYALPSSFYFGLTNNHILRQFVVGYGLQYAENYYIFGFDSFDPDEQHLVFRERKVNHTAGAMLNVYRRIGKTFSLGVIYRPSLLHFRHGIVRSCYEHQISLDLLWAFRLNDR